MFWIEMLRSWHPSWYIQRPEKHGTQAMLKSYPPPVKISMASWKIIIFIRKYIFEWLVFHCHVGNLGGCRSRQHPTCESFQHDAKVYQVRACNGDISATLLQEMGEYYDSHCFTVISWKDLTYLRIQLGSKKRHSVGVTVQHVYHQNLNTHCLPPSVVYYQASITCAASPAELRLHLPQANKSNLMAFCSRQTVDIPTHCF